MKLGGKTCVNTWLLHKLCLKGVFPEARLAGHAYSAMKTRYTPERPFVSQH